MRKNSFYDIGKVVKNQNYYGFILEYLHKLKITEIHSYIIKFINGLKGFT